MKIYGIFDQICLQLQQRFNEIQGQIVALKRRQWSMGIVKMLLSILFGVIAYSSTLLSVSAGISGLSVVINFYNNYELKALIGRIQQDGYIV